MRFLIDIPIPFIENRFENLFCRGGKIYEHKYYIIEFLKDGVLLSLDVDITLFGEDHAGANLSFGVFGYSLHIGIYDNRHWNFEKDDWI